MKHQQQAQARDLYFNTNLSKTEIADKVKVNRRTILLWSQQGNWDRLRQSARHMPALIAEKCYFLLDQYTTHLLSSGNVISTFGLKQAQAIHLLANTIRKLKNRSTINESMEMFSFFMEGLNRRDPKLAAEILPHIESYINSRESVSANDFLSEEFAADGASEKEILEQQKDEEDQIALMEEFEIFLQHRNSNPKEETPSSEKNLTGMKNTPPDANDDDAATPINTPTPIPPSPRPSANQIRTHSNAHSEPDIRSGAHSEVHTHTHTDSHAGFTHYKKSA